MRDVLLLFALAHFFMHFYKRVFLCCLLSSIDTSEGETYQVPGTTKEQSIFFCPVTSRTVLSLVCHGVLCGQKSETCTKLSISLIFFFSLCFRFVGYVAINTGNAFLSFFLVCL